MNRRTCLIPVLLVLGGVPGAAPAAEITHELFLAGGTMYSNVGRSLFCPQNGNCSTPDYTHTVLHIETQIRKDRYYASTGASLSRAAHFLEGAVGIVNRGGDLLRLHWGVGPTLMWNGEHEERRRGNVTDLGVLLEGKLTFGLDLRLHLRGALRFVRSEPASGEFTVGVGGG